MDSIIGGIEEVYRDSSRNGMFADSIDTDNRCNDYNNGPCFTGNLIESESTRLIRLALCSLCWCSSPYNWGRIW